MREIVIVEIYKYDTNSQNINLFFQWESAPGYIVVLLQIVASNEVDAAIRQAGAINLKNMAKKWRPAPPTEGSTDPPDLDFPEADRNTVKENIVEALVHSPPLVRYTILLLGIENAYFDCLEHNWHLPLQQFATLISLTSGIASFPR